MRIENLKACEPHKTVFYAENDDIDCLLKRELNVEPDDNLIFLTTKYKFEDVYDDDDYIPNTYEKKSEFKDFINDATKLLFADINLCLGYTKTENALRNATVTQLSYDLICTETMCDYPRIEHFPYKFAWYCYSIINIKKATINDIRHKLYGKNDYFMEWKYESAEGSINNYTKPFNKKIYIEAVDDFDKSIKRLLKHKDGIGYDGQLRYNRKYYGYPCLAINVLNDSEKNIRYLQVPVNDIKSYYDTKEKRIGMDKYIKDKYIDFFVPEDYDFDLF